MIESIEEAVRGHLEAGVAAATRRFRGAVHPIYRGDRKDRPTLFGTCFALELDGRRYLVTAAHVVDDIAKDGGFIPSDTGLVPLLGQFHCTKPPDSDRDKDQYDFAWKELGDDEISLFGWNTFFRDLDICENRAPTDGRVYLALGYPRSKNKKANPQSRRIRPKLHRYYSTGKAFPQLFASLELTGKDHIAIDHALRSKEADGTEVNSFYPRGMSGGPFLDLGRKGSPADLAREVPYEGRLAGILIEKYDNEDALVAVKVDSLVAAIRSEPHGSQVVSMHQVPDNFDNEQADPSGEAHASDERRQD